MNEGYGNAAWEIFVYSSYIIVSLILIIYIFYSIKTRNKSLQEMNDEGFFQNENQKNN